MLTVGAVLPMQGPPPWQGSAAASGGTRPGQQAKASTFTGTQVQQQALTQDNRSLVVGDHSCLLLGRYGRFAHRHHVHCCRVWTVA